MTELADTNGIRTAYRLEGRGPCVALVHGVGADLQSWDGVVAGIRQDFRCLRYDLRGHGESDKPTGPYHIEDFADDLASLLEAVDVTRCHLVGFSLGGLIAQRFALTHLRRIDRLVLLSTVAGRTEHERAGVLERLRAVENGDPGAHVQNSLTRWFSDAFLRDNPDMINQLTARNIQHDPRAYAAAYRVLATCDLADELHEIRAPTLIATGEGDIGSSPRMARLMHERIADSRLEILPGLRHSILMEAPATVAQLLTSFLTNGSNSAGW